MMPLRRRFESVVAAAGMLLALAHSWSARADPAELTSYERLRVRQTAERLRLPSESDPEPEGKLIESISVEVLEVFDDEDPVPNFINLFHVRTRERVVRRELLFHAGQRYDAERAQESARNLRKLRQHTMVVVLALPGTAPDRVRVLVVVKDVWSLRLNVGVGGGWDALDGLVVNLAEENLFGTHSTLGAIFTYDPGTYGFGAHGQKRSLFGSDVDLSLLGTVIYGRATGAPEGWNGSMVYGAPLASAESKWSWGTGVAFDDRVARVFEGGAVYRYDPTGAPPGAVPREEMLPVQYRSERMLGGCEVTRSFGRVHKLELTAGVEVDRRRYHWGVPPGTSARDASAFREAWVPVSDMRVSPFVQLYQHEERYLRTSELETLGLEENYALGAATLLRVYPASQSLASSRDLLGVNASVSYTLPVGDGLIRAVGANRVELERNGRHDADAALRLRVAAPRTEYLRVVVDGIVRSRYRNYLNRDFQIGGDSRLRGYPHAGFSEARKGPSVAAVNAELRSRSVGILGSEVGAVAFYDAADAGPRLTDLRLRQSAGLGARIALPFLSRAVARADLAVPIGRGHPALPFRLDVYFSLNDQAFPMPALEAPTVMEPKL